MVRFGGLDKSPRVAIVVGHVRETRFLWRRLMRHNLLNRSHAAIRATVGRLEE